MSTILEGETDRQPRQFSIFHVKQNRSKQNNSCNQIQGSWLWVGYNTLRSELNNLSIFHVLVLTAPHVKSHWRVKLYISYQCDICYTVEVRPHPDLESKSNTVQSLQGQMNKINKQTLINMYSPKRFRISLIRIKCPKEWNKITILITIQTIQQRHERVKEKNPIMKPHLDHLDYQLTSIDPWSRS